MWCVTPSCLSPLTSSWKVAAALLLLSVWHSNAVFLDEDIVTTIPTSDFPARTVLCPGGYWTVAVTTFGVHRGSFGKARIGNGGGVQAYFPYEGRERMDAQSMDLLQVPSVDAHAYRWVDLTEYFKKKKSYKPVRKDDNSPFAYYHPGDGGNWQLGKIDLARNVGSYTVAGKIFEVQPGLLEKGKILVVSFKEYVPTYRRNFRCCLIQLVVALLILLCYVELNVKVPFSFNRLTVVHCVGVVLATLYVRGHTFPDPSLAYESDTGTAMVWYRDVYTYWKKMILLAVTIMLNIIAFSLVLPFIRRSSRGISFLSSGAPPPAQSGRGEPHESEPHQERSNRINVIDQRPRNRATECNIKQNKGKNFCLSSSSSLRKVSVIEEAANKGGAGNMNLNVKLLDSVIGVGGFGAVEQGIWDDKRVAVKFVNPMSGHDAASTIMHELDVFQRIPDHENVVKCYGQCTDGNNRVGLVEELMDMSMDDWVHGEGFRMNTALASLLDVFIGIVKGLEHLHKSKIVHYDLKPKNILMNKGLVAKVADFGCSKIKANSYITAGLAGTIPYLAPECVLAMYCNWKGKVRAEKIDVFSFGVVMWEALMGSIPGAAGDNLDFEDDFTPGSASACTNGGSETVSNAAWSSTSTQRLNNCLATKFPISSSCPAELRDLVLSCMRVDNRSRPKCAEVRLNLEKMKSAPWASKTVSQVLG